MFYPTHSVSMIVSVTGAHVTHVSGMGFVDRHPEPAGEVTGVMAKVTGSDGTHMDVSSVHPVHLLPKEYLGLGNGHNGLHQFLVHDFVTACVSGKTPPNNIGDAARYLVPGLIAHESAMRGGVLLEVPDFGDPPRLRAARAR